MKAYRVAPVQHGRTGDLRTLAQQFRFEGATADAVAEVLMTAPLVGDRSLFGGARTSGVEDRTAEDGTPERVMRDFSPVPAFVFDVAFRQVRPLAFAVRFSQPKRETPYLAGGAAWLLSDAADGTYATWDEQINTPEARVVIEEPLTGRGHSMRRRLFFQVGHAKVMERLTDSVAALLS